MSHFVRLCLAALLCGGGAMAGDWISLFDGTSLKGWAETGFHGHGPVAVKDGAIVIGMGRITGITFQGSFPKSGYEIRFEAARLEGNDYFAGITFPVKETYCTWVNGGWDGTVIGLSNLDGDDASENDTSINRDFVKGRWYRFRLEVTEKRIRAWVDDALLIEADIQGRRIGLREFEMELNTPLGFSSYKTVAGVRKVEYRLLDAI